MNVNSLIKTLPLILLSGFLYTTSQAQAEKKAKDDKHGKTSATNFNAELAEQLNADPYGMKNYVMAILKAGPNRSKDSTIAAKLQKAHLDNIFCLAKEGKLILAGPFLDKSELKGIYIFNVETIEEAKKLTETDPAIKAGSLIMELHPWYGSAALQQVNSIHESIQKEQF